MYRCRYYENGKCNVLGDSIMIDCATIRNSASDICASCFNGKYSVGKHKKNNRQAAGW